MKKIGDLFTNDPEVVKRVMIKMLKEAGVRTLYGCTLYDVIAEDGNVNACIFHGRDQSFAITAKQYVDASGDLSIVRRAGGKYEKKDDGTTLLNRMANVDIDKIIDWFEENADSYSPESDIPTSLEDTIKNWREFGVFHLPHGGGARIKVVKDAIESGKYSDRFGKHAENLKCFGLFSARCNKGTVLINSNWFFGDCYDIIEESDDWLSIRKRYNPHSPERFPEHWNERADALRQSDCPIRMAIPGLYWRTRDWVGFENLSMMFYDNPRLVHDMMEHITIFIMEIVRKVHQDARLDCLMLNEDMAYKHASMISPAMFCEFMLPRYKRLAILAEELGVPVVMVDCDGHVSELIPLWIEVGIHSTYPTEIAANNDPVAYRKQYGDKMAIFGGIDKRTIRSKKQTYQEIMSKIPWLIKQGGFLPSVDHAVPLCESRS